MDVSAYRDRFPILAETTYLINHSLAAMPAAAFIKKFRDEFEAHVAEKRCTVKSELA